MNNEKRHYEIHFGVCYEEYEHSMELKFRAVKILKVFS